MTREEKIKQFERSKRSKNKKTLPKYFLHFLSTKKMNRFGKLLTVIFLACIINCFAERQPLKTKRDFDSKYDIELQDQPHIDHGRQGDLYFGRCKDQNVIHDLKGNLITEVAFKAGKLNEKKVLQNVTEEVKFHDYLLNGKIDMEFGVLPVLDIVDFVDQKTKKRFLGFVMPTAHMSLFDSFYYEKPMTLVELKKLAIAGFRSLKNMGTKGIVHKDMKGANLALGFEEWSHILYVLDFGMADIYTPDTSNKKHPSIGNGNFKSVEILKGLHKQGPADDMYSFCEILLGQICGISFPWSELRDLNEKIASRIKFDTTEKIVREMGKREYVLQLLKDDNSETTEEQFYAMFDNCIQHAKRLSTSYQKPKAEWYDDAAKFFE